MGSEVLTAATICIVDDDEAVRDSLHLLLKARGFAVRTYESAKSFLADAARRDYQCLLVDMHMPEMTGLALIQTLREQDRLAPAIMVTAGTDPTLTEQVVRAGALGLLKKPVNEDELVDWVGRAVEQSGRSGSTTAR